MKTYTIKEIEKKLAEAMKIDSPLGQKIIAKFKDTPPDVEAKQILESINKNRFSSSGYIYSLSGELATALDKVIDTQIRNQYSIEHTHGLPVDGADLFQLGYRIGMGAVSLSRIL